MRALTPRSRLHGEQGASMAIILALIVILGLCVGAIAIQGQAGMLAVQGVKNQRQDVYGAEGAIDAAINYIRGDLTRGRWDDANCPADTANPNFFSSPSDGGTVTVSCKSLAPGGLEIEGINYPENAIRTLSGLPGYPAASNSCDGDAGICIDGPHTGRMTVDGSVKSNASKSSNQAIRIEESGDGTAYLDVNDNSVRATGNCTPVGHFIDASPLDCKTGETYPDPSGTDATTDPTTGRWAPLIQTMPPPAPLPTCNPTSKVATMYPGSYFDRNAMLRAFTKVVSGTRRSCPVVWMQPGSYYFDFYYRNEGGSNPTVLTPVPTGDPWRIGHNDAEQDDIYSETFNGTDIPGSVVIGGTPSGWSPTAGSSQVNAARNAVGDPGACDRGADGVRVMMANNTAFDVKDEGLLELCPTPESARQRLVLVSRKTDQTATAAATGTFRPWRGSSSPGSWDDTFDPNLLAIDGATASVAQTGPSKTSQMNFERFGPTTVGVLPQQSLSSVVLRIAHQETTAPTTSGVTITAKIVRPDGTSPSACTTTSAFTKQTSLTTQAWTVPSSCIGNVDQLAGAKVEWSVRSSSSGNPTMTTVLDGAEFAVTYTGQSGLQAKTPGTRIIWMYGPWGDKRPGIYVWGTVYAPTATIHLELAGVSTTNAQFGRGVVVASIWVDGLSVTHSYAMFGNATGVPHYQDRFLELIAYVNGKPYLRVWVEFDDMDPSKPGRIVRIKRWNAAA
jgi:hypothetical protein